MKYLLLLMGDGELKAWSEHSEEEQEAVFAQFGEFDATCAARGVTILAGEALAGPETFTTLRTRDGRLDVTDGPFAEAVEGMGGFYLLEAPDLDRVLEVVTALPAYDMQIVPVTESP